MRRWSWNTSCESASRSRWCSPRSACARACSIRCSNEKDKEKDALIEAARELNQLRSRSPRHGEELIDWTDRFMATSGLDETAEERRLRHAACLLADIGWRAHPDYRGEQSLNIIAHGGFTAIDHPGRAYLALPVFYRHVGLVMDDELSPRLRELALDPDARPRARARRGDAACLCRVRRRCPACCRERRLRSNAHRLALHLPGEYAALAGERVLNRLRSLARSDRPRARHADGVNGRGARAPRPRGVAKAAPVLFNDSHGEWQAHGAGCAANRGNDMENLKRFFAVIAVISVLNGIGLVLTPDVVLADLRDRAPSGALLGFRLLGLTLIEFGLINWFVRKSHDWTALRGLLIGGTVGYILGLIVSALGHG